LAETCDCDAQQNLSLNGFSCLLLNAFLSIIGGYVSQKVTNYMIIHLLL